MYKTARNETIRYHEEYYGKHKLFEKGSWLEKPDQLTMDLVARLSSHSQDANLILDLGCGIGRNSIPIARYLKSAHSTSAAVSKIICVDMLQTAIDKLLEHAQYYKVADQIIGIQSDFEVFGIAKNSYDLVLAVSVLEHCINYQAMLKIIDDIIAGTKSDGYNRLEFTTNRDVRNRQTGEQIPTKVETPLESDQLMTMLKEKYQSWHIEKLELMPYREVLSRDGSEILWQSTQLNFIAHKPRVA